MNIDLSKFDEEQRALLESVLADNAKTRERNAELEAKNAELQAKKSKRAAKVNLPSVTVEKDGQITQEELECVLLGQGGPWYSAAHIARDVAKNEQVLYLRKYRKVRVKEGKAREGESVGDMVLRQASSFKVNSPEQWRAILEVGARCFPQDSE